MSRARFIVDRLLTEAPKPVPADAEQRLRQYKAFFGFNEENQARICAYCADKPEADKEVEALGLDASHSICPTHAKMNWRDLEDLRDQLLRDWRQRQVADPQRPRVG